MYTQGEVPLLPKDDDDQGENDDDEEQACVHDDGPDCLVYGESSLLDALEASRGIYGSTIFPRSLFEVSLHLNDGASLSPRSFIVHRRASNFVRYNCHDILLRLCSTRQG